MKKELKIYIVIYALVTCISLYTIIFEKVRQDNTILFLVSLTTVIAGYFVLKGKFFTLALTVLTFVNFLQSISFTYGGLTYSFLFGPEITLNLNFTEDVKLGMLFKPINRQVLISQIPHTINNIGFNIFHLFLGVWLFLKGERAFSPKSQEIK